MIKLASMTWPYAKYPFEQALEQISEAGFRYVSIGLPHEGQSVINAGAPGEASRILALLDKYDLQPVTLISNDALGTKQPIEAAQQWMDFALELGVDELLSVGTFSYGRFPNEPISDEEMIPVNDAFVAKFQQVGEEAKKRGLTVSLKPHTGNTATAKELKETLDRIDSPAVKASYDPGNIHFYEGVDTVKDLPSIAEQVVSFIIKDHEGKQTDVNFPVPGEGDVDFPALFSILKKHNFSGPVVLERLDGQGENFTLKELNKRVATSRKNIAQILQAANMSYE